MVFDSDLTGQNDTIADVHTAGHADLRDDHAVLADGDVVADVDEVVNFRSRTDARGAGARLVNRDIRADFHIVFYNDAPDLRDFIVTVVNKHVAEAVGAEDASAVNDDGVSDLRIIMQDHLGINHTVITDGDIVADIRKWDTQRSFRPAGHCHRLQPAHEPRR